VDASWSPDGSRIAYEPVRWNGQGYGPSASVLVIDASGSERTFAARGHLAGWTPDGRIVIWSDRAMRDLIAVDPASGRRTLLLAGGEAEQLARVDGLGLGEPVFSRNGRFMAARVYGWPAGSRITAGILIATAGGRGVRLVKSRYVISMIAWSPAGDLLAYTTSGSPDPHELFIVGPAEGPRRLYEGPAHFDWVTWSPDGRWVLIDDEALDRWLLFKPKDSGRSPLWLPRLGGAPMWCCPQGTFEAEP
jgi:Tol biopolymer transport system component